MTDKLPTILPQRRIALCKLDSTDSVGKDDAFSVELENKSEEPVKD